MFQPYITICYDSPLEVDWRLHALRDEKPQEAIKPSIRNVQSAPGVASNAYRYPVDIVSQYTAQTSLKPLERSPLVAKIWIELSALIGTGQVKVRCRQTNQPSGQVPG
jgi:hypothetical protein